MNVDGHKLAAASVLSAASGMAMQSAQIVETHLQDVTQVGQVVSIVVSIISGIVSLVKLLRKKK